MRDRCRPCALQRVREVDQGVAGGIQAVDGGADCHGLPGAGRSWSTLPDRGEPVIPAAVNAQAARPAGRPGPAASAGPAGHAAHERNLDGRPRPRRNAAAHYGLPCPGGQPLPAARRPPRPVPAAPARWPHHRAAAVSSRGGLMVARQKIHAGMIHAGKTATVICENTCFRVVIDGETAAVVPPHHHQRSPPLQSQRHR